MNQDPSVLDFIKARMRYWRSKLLHPSENMDETNESRFWIEGAGRSAPFEASANQALTLKRLPWWGLLAVGMGLLGQISLEPHPGSERTWQLGVILYLLACLFLIRANGQNEFTLQAWEEHGQDASQDTRFLQSSIAFIVSLAFSLFAFVAFGGSRFTGFNLFLWSIGILTMIQAFWLRGTGDLNWVKNAKDVLFGSKSSILLNRSTLLFLAVLCLALFFRFYRLLDVPSEMISDHAEKLLDIGDVLNGKTSIFFQRNTGREFFQFYLTAAIILVFKTGLTYLSLKIGTVLAGVVALFYIYLLGKEIGNTRVGLLAMTFAGIAYWPNIISRYGLRFPLYPLFYGPAIYYLVRGLRTRNRNNFILSGLFLGLGLHGYSPFRVVPIVILLAVGLYLVHKQSEGYRRQAIWGLITIIILSLIVFSPLLRYMLENPDMVLYRAMTRLGDLERPLPGPVWQIFLQNFWNSLTMFGWDNGEIWPISIPHRPVLDVVTSVFFHLGVILLTIRYIRQRHWMDIFTLISIPMLMMPSILSLSFPGENPSLNRSAAALIPVFLVVGLAFDGFMVALESISGSILNERIAWAAGILLLIWASSQNYDLVFNQYKKQYDLASWNTSEMGKVIRGFTEMTGNSDTAWLVGYPHWVDSRLVMINAGFPMQDNAIWPQNFQDTLDDPDPKLFLVNIDDLPAIEALQSLYPRGWLKKYESKYENKDFMLFFVPVR
jgi:hypothetical protein